MADGEARSAEELEREIAATREALVADVGLLKHRLRQRVDPRYQLHALRTHMRTHPQAWRVGLGFAATFVLAIAVRTAARRRELRRRQQPLFRVR
jgi:hypothetical protein